MVINQKTKKDDGCITWGFLSGSTPQAVTAGIWAVPAYPNLGATAHKNNVGSVIGTFLPVGELVPIPAGSKRYQYFRGFSGTGLSWRFGTIFRYRNLVPIFTRGEWYQIPSRGKKTEGGNYGRTFKRSPHPD